MDKRRWILLASGPARAQKAGWESESSTQRLGFSRCTCVSAGYVFLVGKLRSLLLSLGCLSFLPCSLSSLLVSKLEKRLNHLELLHLLVSTEIPIVRAPRGHRRPIVRQRPGPLGPPESHHPGSTGNWSGSAWSIYISLHEYSAIRASMCVCVGGEKPVSLHTPTRPLLMSCIHDFSSDAVQPIL